MTTPEGVAIVLGPRRSRGTSRGGANTWLHPQLRPQGTRACALHLSRLVTAWIMWFPEERTNCGQSASLCCETLHL